MKTNWISPWHGCDIMTGTRTDPARHVSVIFVAFTALVFAVSVAATIYFCRSMAGGMDMPGGWTMSMMWMRMPGQSWPAATAMFLLMWLVMMVAMMLPSAFPMLLNFRRPLTKNGNGSFGAPLLLVASGYFFVWLVCGVAVYALGVPFALAAMHLDWLSRSVPLLSGVALIVAGAFQFTSWKMSGLRRCRNSLCGATGQSCDVLKVGWRYGLEQGRNCCICCVAPMLALLALGAMNLGVMTLVAAVIAMEKLMPKPKLLVRCFGIVAVMVGMAMASRALFRY
jgi:predicted metal-binding membrane protein